jgi:hypothetical protein
VKLHYTTPLQSLIDDLLTFMAQAMRQFGAGNRTYGSGTLLGLQ